MSSTHPAELHRRSRGRSALSMAAGAAVALGALAGPPLAATAAAPGHTSGAGAGHDVGPHVTFTNEGPTGHEVTFTYEAPAGVESVQIYGEWWFSQPESVTCQGCGDARTGAEWQPGDILAGPWQTLPMEQREDGVWTFTTPLPSGTFRYAFTHDCESPTAGGCTLHPDPENPLEVLPHADARGSLLSRVYVPSSQRFPTYDNDYQQPVQFPKAGTLEERRYASPLSTNPPGEHDVVVYLPHGYDPDRSVPYPTLYLSHGAGGNATDWTMEGVAHHILENAIQDGEAPPMVVVSTDFYGLPDGEQGYANELRDNVIPFIEDSYHVSERVEDRAYAGLSAGGGRGVTLLYDNTELFDYYGLWSAAGSAPTEPTEEQVQRMREVDGGIHISTGLQDHQSNIAERSLERADNLRAAGIDVTEWNIDGVHVWDVWRQQLNHYLRTTAFRTTTTEVAVHDSGNRTRVEAQVAAVSTLVTTPTGKVDFYAGGEHVGSAPVKKDGTARLRTQLPSGAGEVVARYRGDELFNASDSAG